MTEQTRIFVEEKRAELTDEQRAAGWDYVTESDPEGIWGFYVDPYGNPVDGTYDLIESFSYYEVVAHD